MTKASGIPHSTERGFSATVFQYNKVSGTSPVFKYLYLTGSEKQGVDEAIDLVAGHLDETPLAPGEARRIRDKIDWVILPLLFALYTGKRQRILSRRSS